MLWKYSKANILIIYQLAIFQIIGGKCDHLVNFEELDS